MNLYYNKFQHGNLPSVEAPVQRNDREITEISENKAQVSGRPTRKGKRNGSNDEIIAINNSCCARLLLKIVSPCPFVYVFTSKPILKLLQSETLAKRARHETAAS